MIPKDENSGFSSISLFKIYQYSIGLKENCEVESAVAQNEQASDSLIV
jgi:hypothetical protein